MATFLKTAIKRSVADNLLTDLSRADNQYFFFVAKSTEWTNPNSPDTHIDTDREDINLSRGIIGYKKLNPSNVIFTVPRYDWEYGRKYDQYDDAINLFDSDDPKIFYVFTNQFHIYKCLYNGGGATSVVQPSLVLSTPFTTSDGYIWKYLGTVSESLLPSNLTDYLPINYITNSTDTETQNQYNTQIQAKNGAITRIDISKSTINGIYTHSITDTPTSRGLLVSRFVGGTGSVNSLVEITEPISVAKITNLTANFGNASNFNGYVLRVKDNASSVSQINNYGVIVGQGASGSGQYFYVKNDAIDFNVTVPTSGSLPIVEVLPFIKIRGDGSGAYVFPNMTGNVGGYSMDSVELASSGIDYTHAKLEIIPAAKENTTPPTFTAVLSPKGGHGGNILRELNADRVLMIVVLTEEDEEKIRAGGSYRQFGIIKNPTLTYEKGSIAGTLDNSFKDITLVYVGLSNATSVANTIFGTTADSMIIGSESFSTAKVEDILSSNPTTNRVVVRTRSGSDSFVAYQDRSQDYLLSLSVSGSMFKVGEKLVQYIPVGTTFTVSGSSSLSGVSFAYGIYAEGIVLNVPEVVIGGYTLGVRSTKNSFAKSSTAQLVGDVSGVTGTILKISPRYGELTHTAQLSDGLAFTSENQFKILEVGESYFDESNTSRYSGLHALQISTSANGVTGAIDTTSDFLTPSSFLAASVIEQGSTGSFDSDYASGVVYYWDFVNASNGVLWVTEVEGKFKNIADDGLTGSNLGKFVVSGVSLPDIDPNSGEILYIDNVRAVDRVVGQDEEFRLTIGF